MATIKSYTDLQQSKKLAEILPLETADMCYKCLGEDPYDIVMRPYTDWKEEYKGLLIRKDAEVIPCWSLATLLDIIPYCIHKSDNEFYRLEIDKGHSDYAVWYSNNGLTINDLDVTSDNPIDACVAMIEKLHELKML